MSKKKNRNTNNRRGGLSATLRKPAVQLALVAFVVFIVFLIASANSGGSGLAGEVNVDQAYQMYQQSNTFVVDVRTQEEWDEYHAPNTTLIPLDELPNR